MAVALDPAHQVQNGVEFPDRLGVEVLLNEAHNPHETPPDPVHSFGKLGQQATVGLNQPIVLLLQLAELRRQSQLGRGLRM